MGFVMVVRRSLLSLVLLSLLSLLFTLQPAVAAGPDFTASGPANYYGCMCSQISYVFTVKNTGYVDSPLFLSQSGQLAEFSTLQDNQLYLKSGEEKTVVGTINQPCLLSGIYTLTTTITGQQAKKQLTQTVHIAPCMNMEVTPIIDAAHGCRCEPLLLVYDVRNTGNYADTYSFSLRDFSEYVIINPQSRIVPPGQTERVYIYLKFPCSFSGEKETLFVVATDRSSLELEKPLKAALNESCYEYEYNATAYPRLGPVVGEDGRLRYLSYSFYGLLIAVSIILIANITIPGGRVKEEPKDQGARLRPKRLKAYLRPSSIVKPSSQFEEADDYGVSKGRRDIVIITALAFIIITLILYTAGVLRAGLFSSGPEPEDNLTVQVLNESVRGEAGMLYLQLYSPYIAGGLVFLVIVIMLLRKAEREKE